MAGKLKVFLSHSGSDNDNDLIKGIEILANDKGCLDLYIAERKKEPGRDIIKKVEEALRKSHCVWALLTPDGNASEFVQNEIGAAYILGIRIIPMVEEGVKLRGMLYGKEPVPFNRTGQVAPIVDTVGYLANNCDKIRKEKPKSSDALVKKLNSRICEIEKENARLSKEKEEVKLAASSTETKDRHLFDLACEFSIQGRHEAAEVLFTAYLIRHPEYSEAHFNLGFVLGEQGKTGEEIEEYKKAIVYNPNDVRPHNNLGLRLALKKKYVEAEKELRVAVSLEPSDPGVHYNLGLALGEQAKHKEAEAEYREAIRLNESHGPSLVGLAFSLDLQGRKPEARKYWIAASKVVKDPEGYGLIQCRLAEPD